MRIVVDLNRCLGYAQCVPLAPEVLKLNGDQVGIRPALSVGVLCLFLGVQMISLGLLSELILHLRGARGPDAYAEDV